MVVNLTVLSQKQIHLFENDSLINVKKVKYSVIDGTIKYVGIGKVKSYVNLNANDVEYLTINKRIFGISRAGLIKVDDVFFINESSKKGALDACRHYTKYRPAASGTYWTTALTGGVIGLIPAISTSSTSPKEKNLLMPEGLLKADPGYTNAYKKQAKNMKQGKVWGSYGIGVVTATILGILTSTIIVRIVESND
jgi:hypothetical protein